ncbi:MAG: pyridoxamine 5'-phosphate oxidase family protein [Micromonosporaceae bacterium]|nr:pyridoxamine 5'-phosphate oxidase family protein [Micromonosporaceae bacterium]
MAGSGGRGLVEVDRAEAMALLGSVAYGRVVFTLNALPAVRPVNHLVDGEDIIIRTRLSSAVGSRVRPAPGVVVAYQADQIDPDRRLGWSVVVTGYASPVTAPDQIARYEAALIPWVDMTMDTVLRIRPQIVTGFRLVATDQAGPS